jgi:hypothetical protein
MPWSVEREGAAVHVRIEGPTDWEALYDRIRAELLQPTERIVIPAELHDATRTEANMLEMLRRTLADTGIPVEAPDTSN